jgi:hypothetical protein
MPFSQPIGKASKRLIADKAYDSAELRLWLKDRGTKASHSQPQQQKAAVHL